MRKSLYYRSVVAAFLKFRRTPVVYLPFREVHPPMAAEESSTTDQQLTLDQISLEKLLAAAWVLQCVQDQMQASKGKRGEEFEAVNKDVAASSDLQSVLQFSAGATGADSLHEAPPARPVNYGTLVIPAEIERAVSSEPLPSIAADIRNVSNYVRSSSSNRSPNIRVKLTLRGLRAVRIATPVWVLSLVAAALFVEVWRHDSTQSAQATTQPIPATLKATVTNPSAAPVAAAPTKTALTITRPTLPKKIQKSDKEPQLSKASAPREVSHKQITDPGAFFAVQQLSRYEIETLRRQAQYGDDSAAFALGMAYEVGRFVPQNCKEAARWVASAAEEGNAAAQYNLGLRYRDGDGVPIDLFLSDHWLRKAAAHSNKRASLASKLFTSH